MTDHYPGYKKVSDTEGKIGDVTVKWTITPSDDNAYQNALDEALKKQILHQLMTRSIFAC